MNKKNFTVKTIKSDHLCDKCKKRKSQVQHYNFRYCRSCFLPIIDRRIKRHLNLRLKRNNNVLVIGDISEFFFRRIFEHIPNVYRIKEYDLLGLIRGDKTEIIKKKIKEKEINIVFIPWTIDHKILFFSDILFSKKLKNIPDTEEIFTKLFRTKTVEFFRDLTEEELRYVAKLKNISYTEINEKKYPLKNDINMLQERFAGIKSTYFNNIQKLRGIFNNQ